MKKETEAVKSKLMTVQQYASTRTGWRGYPVTVGYIYKLIKQYEAGEKSAAEIGFIPRPNRVKGYAIEAL